MKPLIESDPFTRNKKRKETPFSNAYVGIGSNLGDRVALIKKALDLLRADSHMQVKQVSSLYETDPVGGIPQGRYLNAACHLLTSYSPYALLKRLKEIEDLLGRRPCVRNGPRLIDLDILFFDCLVLHDSRLQIPHPRIQERLFVLTPLVEIAPDWIHPLEKRSITNMLENYNEDSTYCQRLTQLG